MPVDEALQRILAGFEPLEEEVVSCPRAHGRVLARDLHAPRDLPSFPNSSMDGFALRSADLQGGAAGPLSLEIAGEAQAGRPWKGRLSPGQAVRIMTGAPLPEGADAVVPVEEAEEAGGRVSVAPGVRPGSCVRQPGEDVRRGERVLAAGERLGASAMGMLAALGQARVAVRRRPRLAILSSGDELLRPGEPLEPGKIHDANGPALAALAREYGARPTLLPPLADEAPAVAGGLEQALGLRPDLILTSGGVSVGTYDLLRRHLETRGEIHLWRVRMQPGKPLLFGRLQGVPLLGLPGNPVSSLMTAHVFLRPVLARMLGTRLEARTVQARLAQGWENRSGRRQYLRVRLERRDGQLWAALTGPQGSHILSSMVRARGILVVTEGGPALRAGDPVEVELLS